MCQSEHVKIQFSQQHLLMRLSFPGSCLSLSKIGCRLLIYFWGFYYVSLVYISTNTKLLKKYNNLCHVLKSSIVKSSISFLLFKTDLAIWVLLCFQINFRNIFLHLWKMSLFNGDHIDLYISLDYMDILIILIFPVHKHGKFFFPFWLLQILSLIFIIFMLEISYPWSNLSWSI